jgi:phage terminase large subunit-like protein
VEWEQAPKHRAIGRLEAAAYERHARDMARQGTDGFPFVFVPYEADKAVALFRLMRHYKGEWAGQEFEPEPWQEFIIRSVYGWRHKETGFRRYRVVFIEVGRKNGKSFLAAGIGICEMTIIGEPAAEVYTAATKLEQARIIHRDAIAILERSPELRGPNPKKPFFKVTHDNITCTLNYGSRYVPLGSDSKTQDGLNVQAGLIDEIHEHKTPDLWGVLDTGTGSRRQPLLFGITTAGVDQESICGDLRMHSERILDESAGVEDEQFFAYVCEPDVDEDGKSDDWRLESTWEKANPNIDVSCKREDLRQKALRAENIPRLQNEFRRKHCNEWVETVTRWISETGYDLNPADPHELAALAGRECWAGCDLSSTRDTTALALAFPVGNQYEILVYYWIPEEGANLRTARDKLMYQQWSKTIGSHGKPLIETTPGNIIDHDFILERAQQLAETYQIHEIAYDPFTATQFAVKANEAGLTMVEHRQGATSMNEPCRYFEALVEAGRLRNGGNPVFRWNVLNTQTIENSTGLIRPTKPQLVGRKGFNDKARIDGAVAAIMALGRARLAVEPTNTSIYSERGVRRL